MDWLPCAAADIRIDLLCSRRADGGPRGWIGIWIRSSTLSSLGLHPDQPTSRIGGRDQPDWWRAEALRGLELQRRRQWSRRGDGGR
jgi:hypothetical protein